MAVKYEVLNKSNPRNPVKELIRIDSPRVFGTSLTAFGPEDYDHNVAIMSQVYTHPQRGTEIYFREPTTAESILSASCDYEHRVLARVLLTSRHPAQKLQLGRVMITREGVCVNPVRDYSCASQKGRAIPHGDLTSATLDKCKKVKGIWLYQGDDPSLKDFGFAPFDTFKTGEQDCDTFAEGGLARVLENEEGIAENLRMMASPKFFKRGVVVANFHTDRILDSKVMCIFNDTESDGARLIFNAFFPNEKNGEGFVYGAYHAI